MLVSLNLPNPIGEDIMDKNNNLEHWEFHSAYIESTTKFASGAEVAEFPYGRTLWTKIIILDTGNFLRHTHPYIYIYI